MNDTWRRCVGTILALSLVGGGFCLAAEGVEAVPKPDTKEFKSDRGGIRVQVPASWYVKEVPGPTSYQVYLSREKVEKKGDLYTYGLGIVRLRDYHDAFKFEGSSPEQIALEFANRRASRSSTGGQSMVIAMPASIEDMKAFKYRIVSGGGTDDCLSMWVLVGIKKKQWIHALWEIPCKERDAQEPAVEAMIQSLVIDPEWGSDR